MSVNVKQTDIYAALQSRKEASAYSAELKDLNERYGIQAGVISSQMESSSSMKPPATQPVQNELTTSTSSSISKKPKRV